jgi:hypothetical protein
MTHDELLAKINIVGDTSLDAALRAVVELHHPVEAEYFDNPVCAACSPDIDTWFDYPCKTIRAIEEELI